MNPNEKPIPIMRGREIDIEKTLKILKQKSAELENLYKIAACKSKDKQVLWNREFMKDPEKINYELISSLAEEIETLDKNAHDLLDEMLKANKLINEGAEHLRDYRELSALMNEIAELEKILKI